MRVMFLVYLGIDYFNSSFDNQQNDGTPRKENKMV